MFKLTCGFGLAGNYAEKEFLLKTHFSPACVSYLRCVGGGGGGGEEQGTASSNVILQTNSI